FFALSVVLGFVIYKAFKIIDKRWPHTRRIPILALALCFGLSYVAEKVFGIADITGAYVAGIILSKLHDSDYIEQKMDINSYMIFGPIFFASIGLKTEISGFTWELLLFSLAFVAVALVSKIIGCGAMSRLCGFKGSDTLKVGVGMMTRGEVALIVAQRGLTEGMIGSQYFTSVILLIIVSSILTPIILKLLYARDEKKQAAA
ncbi:MAG: cation:proton antiporter, partial [Ruminococcus sp.]